MRRKLIQLSAFYMVALLAGCVKYLNTETTLLIGDEVFKTDKGASGVVTQLHIDLMKEISYMNGYITKIRGLYADELTTPTGNWNKEEAAFFKSNVEPDNPLLPHFWTKPYDFITQANTVIVKLASISGTSQAVRTRLTGEVKFLRALFYWYLSNDFGPVPLITGIDPIINSSIGRTSLEEINELIKNDLTDAIQLLSVIDYKDSLTVQRARVTKWAAMALMARFCLYSEDWAGAERYASMVIESGEFSLTKQPSETFLIQSTETIFQLLPLVKGSNTAEAMFFIPAPGLPSAYVITPQLFNSFETNDLRRKHWLGSFVSGGNTFYYPFKYKTRESATVKEYNVVLRLAELYLIRAEARAEQNRLYETDGAVTDINTIRDRAGLLPIPKNRPQTHILAAIQQERRIEFFAEWGHRWYDLKRTKGHANPHESRAEEVLKPLKPDFSRNKILWPVPEAQIRLNKKIAQNDGY